MAVKKTMKRVANVATNVGSMSKSTSLRIRETERIGTVLGSAGFVANSFAINPALPATFPWLASVAGQFEKYKLHRLAFRYKNLKGTSSSGNIILTHETDALDSNPTTSIQMTQGSNWSDGAPWTVFSLDCGGSQELFTRSGAVSNSDLKTYDHGKLVVASEGCADTSVHGYLEVTYDIEFMYKQPSGSGVGAVSTNRQASLFEWTATCNNSAPYAAALTVVRDPISTGNSAGVLTLPAGSYYLTVVCELYNGAAGGQFSLTAQGSVVKTLFFNSINPTGTIIHIVDLPVGGTVGMTFPSGGTTGQIVNGRFSVELL